MRCDHCQAQNREGRRFCAECGAALCVACPFCGFPNELTEKFCGGCGLSLADAGRPEQRTAPAPARPHAVTQAAERRQISVMFCDLVDSTSVSGRLDPEDFRKIVQAYQTACAEVVQRFEGYIAQYLGDGLLVYFGYPQAHEDDAQRAVRAGLGVVEAVAHLNTNPGWDPGVRLAVRVGIHTGLVVVGEVGGGGRHEQLALGEAPNLAARLQGIAGTDTVLVSATTYRLIRRAFDCADLGPQGLKGVSKPVQVYRVIEEQPPVAPVDVTSGAGLTSLVGREREVDLLLDRWELARDGLGQIVLLSGEAGIGKSRLLQVLKECIAGERHTLLECRCSPYYQHTPLYPIVDLFPRLLTWSRQDSGADKLAKLEQTLDRYGLSRPDIAPLLASLVSLPASVGAPGLAMSPALQKRKTMDAILELVLAMAAERPVLLLMEDLHWIDPTTLELLTALLDHTAGAAVLALLAGRPAFHPPWTLRSHVTHLTLSRLTARQSELLVGHLTGGKDLPPELLKEVVTRTDGVPLFVEELTKMVLESGLLRERADHYELTGPLRGLAIPTTLQDSLTARLDRLATVKGVAQLGATLGRAFPYELLRTVSPLDEAALERDLARLVEAEILYQRGLPPHATYVFKHALIQEAAYQSLLKSTRQQHHLRIAQALTSEFREIADTRPEFVAHHYTEAGLGRQAVPYWQQAGQRAIQRSAHPEAISHLTKGLEIVSQLSESDAGKGQELSLQMLLGVPYMATKGYGAPEVEQAYARARVLCHEIGDTPQLFPALRGLWVFSLVRGELPAAQDLATQLLRLAEAAQDASLLLEAHLAVGATSQWLGQLGPSGEHGEQALGLYDPQHHRSHALVYGIDPKVTVLSYAARLLWLLGYPDGALGKSREAMDFARALQHPFSVASAGFFVSMVHQHRGDARSAQESSEHVIAVAREQGFALWSASAATVRGWAVARQGQVDEGISQMRAGLSAFCATGAGLCQPYFLALLSEGYGLAGRTADGLTIIDEALALAARTGERFYEAELHRVKGELLLNHAGAPQDEAADSFRQALDIARAQGARSLELRAALSSARLLKRQGKPDEARRSLAPLYERFTEGLETADLKEARTLLAALA